MITPPCARTLILTSGIPIVRVLSTAASPIQLQPFPFQPGQLDGTHYHADSIRICDEAAPLLLCVRKDDVLVLDPFVHANALYHDWKKKHLLTYAMLHNVTRTSRDNRRSLLEKIMNHVCDARCPYTALILRPYHDKRRVNATVPRVVEEVDTEPSIPEFMQILTDDARYRIIREWQRDVSSDTLKHGACAPCGRSCRRAELKVVHANSIDLTLLQNPSIPMHLQPTTYAFALYNSALLEPAGMTDCWTVAPINICQDCHTELVQKERMPRLSLANWLYYAKDKLPPDVKVAFSKASPFDLMLVSRARSTRISFRFTELRRTHATDVSMDDRLDQLFIKGNILVMPQASTQLADVLPPGPDTIRDTICALFVGKQKPTKETIGKLSPVLVRKSTVKTLIQFLIRNNPHYIVNSSFHGFSARNLDLLFDPAGCQDHDIGVPADLDIGFVQESAFVQATEADYSHRADYTEGPSDQDGFLMENVGYTLGDDSPVAYRDMKMTALSHCLQGRHFVHSSSGDRYIPDFDSPWLLSWLFPHLDPWGIGGFCHQSRSVPISVESQLKYLLSLHDTSFQNDPAFSFVYYNILQKKAVCDTVHFRIDLKQRHDIVEKLLAVDNLMLTTLIHKYKTNAGYRPCSDAELSIVRLLNQVNMSVRDLPGTSGYKVCRRNEIRSLIYFYGTPAFFVTLNPSDINNPLVRLFAGHDIDIYSAQAGAELTEWQRRLLAAKHPAACARFFDCVVSEFIRIILRYGRPDPGILGKCVAYYGTVEAQARGTLHCHMLIWVNGHPSPQQMRDRMAECPRYKTTIMRWLESIIKCEMLGTTVPVRESRDEPLTRTKHSEAEGYIHPGTRAPPMIDNVPPTDFPAQYTSFVNELVGQFNWHEHTETCWKYLRPSQARTDENCRMGIDGTTQETTTVDSESGSILLRRLHPRIANYNDVIVFLVRSNMDIKHIGSGEGAKALIYYVTDYITKASLPTHLGLTALLSVLNKSVSDNTERLSTDVRCKQGSKAMTMLVNGMISRQEISHPQVMSYLVGGGDHYTSHSYKLLNVRRFLRILHDFWPTPDAVEEVNPSTSTTIHHPSTGTANPTSVLNTPQAILNALSDPHAGFTCTPNTVTLNMLPGFITASVGQDEDYLLRPITAPFDGMALYEFVGTTEKISIKSEDQRMSRKKDPESTKGRRAQPRGSFCAEHPQHLTHVLRKRMTWALPVPMIDPFPKPNDGAAGADAWARFIMCLFIPWRSPPDLKSDDETWSDAYLRRKDDITEFHHQIIRNMAVLSECKDARDLNRARRNERPVLSFDGELYELNEDGQGRSDTPLGQQQDRLYDIDPADPDQPHDSASFLTENTRELEEILSISARQAIDSCFGRIINPRPAQVGMSSLLRSEDDPLLAAQLQTMATLKRKRRPAPADDRHELRTPYNAVPNASTAPSITTRGLSMSAHSNPSNHVSAADPATSNLRGVIDQVTIEYALLDNTEQLRAFDIISNHICYGGNQLLMYVGGVGGTGKSHLLKAVLRVLSLLGRSDEALVAAPTGAAAILIGGYTIHSLTMLPGKNFDVEQLVSVWRNVKYLFLDEVSMISASLLLRISKRMQHGKGLGEEPYHIAFGGVNVVFLGDFGQLRPPLQTSLYSNTILTNLTEQHAQNPAAIDALNGVYLWRLVNTVVILKKNHRQISDPAYAELLNRVREGKCGMARYTGYADDYSTLHGRLLQNIYLQDPESTKLTFCDAPIIVGRRKVRDLLNINLLQHHAVAIGETLEYYFSDDQPAAPTLSLSARMALWRYPTHLSEDAMGIMPLFPGMKVMVLENIAFANHVVNGAIGTVYDIRYTIEHGHRRAVVAYIHIPGSGSVADSLPDDVVPIFPQRFRFKWKFKLRASDGESITHTSIRVVRSQLPILPAYAYTDYKSQGRSLDYAIVDLASANSIQGVYVMLSRLRTLKGLAVLRPFPAKTIENRISEELRSELTRLKELDHLTRTRYEQGNFRQTVDYMSG